MPLLPNVDPPNVEEPCLPFPPETALLDVVCAQLEASLPGILGSGREVPIVRGDVVSEIKQMSACLVTVSKGKKEYPSSRHFWTVPVTVELRLDRAPFTAAADRQAAGQKLILLFCGDIRDGEESSLAVDRLSGPGIRTRWISEEDVEDYPRTDNWPMVIRVTFTVHCSALAA